jgi:hypothetical protein
MSRRDGRPRLPDSSLSIGLTDLSRRRRRRCACSQGRACWCSGPSYCPAGIPLAACFAGGSFRSFVDPQRKPSAIILMAYPNATLLQFTKDGLEPTTLRQTDHYRAMQEFIADPKGFVEAAIMEVDFEEREGGV